MRTYRRRMKLAEELGVSKRVMEEATKGLREHEARYQNAIIQSRKVTLLDREMVLDWLRYRDALELGKKIPAFDRAQYQ